MTTTPDPGTPASTSRSDEVAGTGAADHVTTSTVVDLLNFLVADTGRTDRFRQLLRTVMTAVAGIAVLLALSVLGAILLDPGAMLPLAGAVLALAQQHRRRRS